MLIEEKRKKRHRKRRRILGYRLADIDERALRGVRCQTRVSRQH